MLDPEFLKNERSILKWYGIGDAQLDELENRQRERIQQLENILKSERDELAKILNARAAKTLFPERHIGNVFAPPNLSPKMTWKDKILRVVDEAEKPLLAREIGAVLEEWEPKEWDYRDVNNTISVYLTQLVRDGGLIRTKRKGQKGSLYSLPE